MSERKENAKILKEEYRRLHSALREIVNKEDPIGLIGMGAPADEYDPEISAILPKIKECKSVESLQTMIHAVFVKWFDKETASPRGRYRSIAEQVFALKGTL